MTALLDELVDWWSWLLIAPAAVLLAVAGSWLIDALMSADRNSRRNERPTMRKHPNGPASDLANARSSEASGQQ